MQEYEKQERVSKCAAERVNVFTLCESAADVLGKLNKRNFSVQKYRRNKTTRNKNSHTYTMKARDLKTFLFYFLKICDI